MWVIKQGQRSLPAGRWLGQFHVARFQPDLQKACFGELTKNLAKQDTFTVKLNFLKQGYISMNCINYEIEGSGVNIL